MGNMILTRVVHSIFSQIRAIITVVIQRTVHV